MKPPATREAPLPVDVERLRKQFPTLTGDDVLAYVTVTRRIVAASASERAGLTRDTLARARTARGGAPRDDEDRLALRYLAAVEKMQGR